MIQNLAVRFLKIYLLTYFSIFRNFKDFIYICTWCIIEIQFGDFPASDAKYAPVNKMYSTIFAHSMMREIQL